MSISEVYDASAPVSGGAPDGGMGDYIEGLKDDCGFIISKVDWVVDKLTGFSLLEALFKPIAGDFNALASMQKGWGEVASSLDGLGGNYDGLAQQLPGVWTGLAGSSAATRFADVGDMYDHQQEGCGQIADQLGHMIEVAQATAELVAAALDFIDSVVQEILLDAASGPVGWVKGGLSAPGKAKKLIDLIHRGLNAIETFTRAVKAAVTALKYVNAALDVANGVLSFGNNVQSTRAGNRSDETAGAAFG
jgi:hypothetical protein